MNLLQEMAARLPALQAKRLPNAKTMLSVSILRRNFHDYAAVVAGSGPAGLAVVGNLLEKRVKGKVLWVDPVLAAGKINKTWREVPSNTKVDRFVEYAKSIEIFKQIIDKTPAPNAFTILENLQQDEGCEISYAADMCLMLSDGLCELDQVEPQKGKVTGADWNAKSSAWTVELNPPDSAHATTVSASRIILCTGASPNGLPIPVSGVKMQRLDLDTALTPSVLIAALPKDSPVTIAVIGASHSAILVLLNLYNLAASTHPQLRVQWFTRNALRYAEDKDGWILRDNTGLKLTAATFAQENLEDSKLSSSPVGKFVRKIDCSHGKEQQMYQKHLPECTHIIQATGFSPNPLPKFTSGGEPMGVLQYDHHGGGFVDRNGSKVPGLYGAGIAFPERVKDPLGNVELNVGLFKFMKYVKRVGEDWIGRNSSTV